MIKIGSAIKSSQLAAMVIMALAFATSGMAQVVTGWSRTGLGTFDYHTPSNWANGVINGIWDPTLIANTQVITFNMDTVLDYPLLFGYTGNVALSFRGTNAPRRLTLGGDITVSLVSQQTVTIGNTNTNNKLHVDLGGTARTVSIESSNRNLVFYNVISNGTLSVRGIGNFRLRGNEAAVFGNPVTLNGAQLYFDSYDPGVTGTNRLPGLLFADRAILYLNQNGNTTANTAETITGAITVSNGLQTVTLRPDPARHLQLHAGSLSRVGKGTLLIQGTALGTNTLASRTAGSANFTLTTEPSMLGAGGGPGTTTRSILPYAVGDTLYTGSGFTATGGLLSYDPGYGFQVLSKASEYKTTITDGQTALDNVLLTNNSGTPVTLTLNTDTTINSLSFNVSGPTNSGITIAGTGVLKVNSGVVYALGTVSPNSKDADRMTINAAALDLNGREGLFIGSEAGMPSTRGGGLLDILSEIRNDGGNGIMISGATANNVTRFGGSVAHTYTGVTTLNAGVLLLGTTSGINAIPGDIVINGGTLEDAGNRIADTATVTLNSGGFKLQIGNEGDARSETYSNLVMNGGTYTTGASGHSGTTTLKGSAILAGGTMTLSQYTKVNVTNLTTMSGTTIIVGQSFSTTLGTYLTYLTLNGGLVISNTASSAYIPITVNSGDATHSGGKVILRGGLAFIGNNENTNAVTIAAPAGLGTFGVMSLTGTNAFDIGDGLAGTDLAIMPVLTDEGASAGGITKTGAGTLSLGGTNTYTGPTTVSAGTLHVAGSLASAATVGSNAVLAGTGILAAPGTSLTVQAGGSVAPGTTNTIGILTVNGNAQFDDGARMRINVAGASADQLAVSGNVTGSGTVQISVTTDGTIPALPLLIMTAANIDPAFTVHSVPSLGAVLKNNNTELWLDLSRKGTLMLFR